MNVQQNQSPLTTPVPRKRSLTSNKEPLSMSSSNGSGNVQENRDSYVLTSEEEQADRRILKPRVPKPKVTPPTPSAPPSTICDQVSSNTIEPPNSIKKQLMRKSGSTRKKRKHEQDVRSQDSEIGHPVIKGGNSGVEELLKGFQEDIVTLHKNQRQQWQEKLDEIQSQILLSNEQNSTIPRNETIVGISDSSSVPSKWKSAASLIPHDNGSTEEIQESKEINNCWTVFQILDRFSVWSSGILMGLLLWQTMFKIIEIIDGSLFEASPSFWIVYWTITTALSLITVLGFMNRLTLETDPSFVKWILLFSVCICFISSQYLNKSFYFQRYECKRYLSASNQTQIFSSYTCNDAVAGIETDDATDWRKIPCFMSTLASFIIHTVLHFGFKSNFNCYKN